MFTVHEHHSPDSVIRSGLLRLLFAHNVHNNIKIQAIKLLSYSQEQPTMCIFIYIHAFFSVYGIYVYETWHRIIHQHSDCPFDVFRHHFSLFCWAHLCCYINCILLWSFIIMMLPAILLEFCLSPRFDCFVQIGVVKLGQILSFSLVFFFVSKNIDIFFFDAVGFITST